MPRQHALLLRCRCCITSVPVETPAALRRIVVSCDAVRIMSRRFMHHSDAVGAAAAAPSIVPSAASAVAPVLPASSAVSFEACFPLRASRCHCGSGLRPWDGLNLPAGWEQVLGSGSGVSDRRARERCHCGSVHLTREVAALCDGIAVDSASNFHHFLASHSCPTIPQHSLGCMGKMCPHCHALFFAEETLDCCQGGAVCVCTSYS